MGLVIAGLQTADISGFRLRCALDEASYQEEEGRESEHSNDDGSEDPERARSARVALCLGDLGGRCVVSEIG